MQIQNTIEAFEKFNIDFMSKGIIILNMLTNLERTYLLSDIEGKKQILNRYFITIISKAGN